MDGDLLVELRGLEKEFAGTKALKGVSLGFRRGEVHGLLGENGAGKSTLIKILTGVYAPTAGEILLDGKPVRIHSPLDARRLGLGAVYQDAELVASFTVGQNILLGNEPGRLGVDDRAIHDEAARILTEMGLPLDVRRPAGRLSAAEMQLVTLATLFHRRYKLIVLDEPTARLSAAESEVLFRLIQQFRAQGITIVYISHRLKEVQEICDRATILRGGLVSATLDRGEITEDRVTELMVDRSRPDLETYNQGHARSDVLLEVADLATEQLAPLSLDGAVRRGGRHHRAGRRRDGAGRARARRRRPPRRAGAAARAAGRRPHARRRAPRRHRAHSGGPAQAGAVPGAVGRRQHLPAGAALAATHAHGAPRRDARLSPTA